MKENRLSLLVVSCKDYKPDHNWYLCRTDGCIYSAARKPGNWQFDEELLKKYNYSDDYVLLPECPGMTDDEAAEVLERWCTRNNIPYVSDMDDIEMAYRGYYF